MQQYHRRLHLVHLAVAGWKQREHSPSSSPFRLVPLLPPLPARWSSAIDPAAVAHPSTRTRDGIDPLSPQRRAVSVGRAAMLTPSWDSVMRRARLLLASAC